VKPGDGIILLVAATCATIVAAIAIGALVAQSGI